jgi:hypothetical protein
MVSSTFSKSTRKVLGVVCAATIVLPSMRLKWLAVIIACSAVFFAAAPSKAATYQWSYVGFDNGSGTLTTGMAEPNPTPGPPPTSGFLITDITGTWDGLPINFVLPVNSFHLNDNILYPTSTPFLDNAGLAFEVDFGGPLQFPVLIAAAITFPDFQFTGVYFCFDLCAPEGQFTVTPVVPIPAALPLFASGLVGLLLLGWRRKKTAAG